jgi:decaprenylphospho-beta-D-erythro-pentofuranosid-2-ulose 2-reductase
MTTDLPPRATPLQPRKRAIVVGASSGIGAALVKRLAREGYTVAALARRADRLTALCSEVNAAAGEIRAVAYPHDVTDYASVPALLQKIITDLGGLDLFVYNSGIALPTGFKHYNFEKDLRTTEVNYLGALAWLNPVAAMFQSAKAGTIVGISSVAGDRGRVGNPSYNASKAALTSYLESLRNRLTRRGVHVLTVKPGYVATEMTQGQKGMFLVASVDTTVNDIYRAIRRRKQVLYTPWFWGWIMLVIRHIPSFIFRRMVF